MMYFKFICFQRKFVFLKMRNLCLYFIKNFDHTFMQRIYITIFMILLPVSFYIANNYLSYVREIIKFSYPDVTAFHFSAEFSNEDGYPKTHDLIIRRYELDVSYNKAEAVNSLNVAIEMKRAGKNDKAMKIIEHSFSLMPHDPDVLNTYGEFLEDIQNDIIGADQKYYLALRKNPDHKSALMNRQRTATVVEKIDKITLQKIDDKRDKVSKIPENDLALCRAKKEAYFQHIYHTVGIEGNTMTLSQTRSIVETRMAIGGKSIAEHNEILGLDSALKYINSTLIDKLGRITVDDILEIHRRVLGYVDPMESGYFRRTQVFVGGHIPPGPAHIPLLMDEFINWLNSEKAFSLHPVQLAALAHYKLVHIHPFIDGNGRTSRLLMNMILMRAGFPPVIIPKQERHKYYEVLEMANEGDIRPFIRFIAECTDKTLDLFLWFTTTEYAATNIPAIEFDVV